MEKYNKPKSYKFCIGTIILNLLLELRFSSVIKCDALQKFSTVLQKKQRSLPVFHSLSRGNNLISKKDLKSRIDKFATDVWKFLISRKKNPTHALRKQNINAIKPLRFQSVITQ